MKNLFIKNSYDWFINKSESEGITSFKIESNGIVQVRQTMPPLDDNKNPSIIFLSKEDILFILTEHKKVIGRAHV